MTGVVISPLTFSASSDNASNTVYYLEPGTYSWTQVNPGNDTYYIGGYTSGLGFAVLNGNGSNQYGFAVIGVDYTDTYEYMTAKGFYGWAFGGSGVFGGAPPNQSYYYLTVENDLPTESGGTMGGIQLGSDNTLEYSCLTGNGQYGFQVYCGPATGCNNSSLTYGPTEVTIEDDEISYNDLCNYPQNPTNVWPINPVPAGCFNSNVGILASALRKDSAVTSLPVKFSGLLAQGSFIELISRGHAQDWTVSRAVTTGATSVPVLAQRPNFDYPSGSGVHYNEAFGQGISGGGKFWQTDGTYVEYDYVHNNYAQGLWWDTDNDGSVIEHDYFSRNGYEAAVDEISYNARIQDDNFVDNGWLLGECGSNAWNQCDVDSNLAAAVYISESGGDSNVEGRAGFSGEDIENDHFQDNWDGVDLAQSADRFCGSPDNTSSGNCTIGPNRSQPGQTYSPCTGGDCPAGASYYANNSGTRRGCGEADLRTATPSASPDYYDNCLWRTQNVVVSHNVFSFNAAHLPVRCRQTGGGSYSPCGENGLVSDVASGPSWSPYIATPGGSSGWSVIDEITNCVMTTFSRCVSQNNHFSDNTYLHSGSINWGFDYGNSYTYTPISAWQRAGQDTEASKSRFT